MKNFLKKCKREKNYVEVVYCTHPSEYEAKLVLSIATLSVLFMLNFSFFR